jgi:hypothetical protein
MTRYSGRAPRPGVRTFRTALFVLALAVLAAPADAAARKQVAKAAAKPARVSASDDARHRARANRSRTHSDLRKASDRVVPELSYSDEFERAELVERMLNECRGIPYNAYELAQSSGEALRLPAPIQLMTVRVRHPYCAELLRTYAHKTAV